MREGPVQKLCNRDTAVVSAEILYIIKRGEEDGQGEGQRVRGEGRGGGFDDKYDMIWYPLLSYHLRHP